MRTITPVGIAQDILQLFTGRNVSDGSFIQQQYKPMQPKACHYLKMRWTRFVINGSDVGLRTSCRTMQCAWFVPMFWRNILSLSLG
jgi:hypothetical protein